MGRYTGKPNAETLQMGQIEQRKGGGREERLPAPTERSGSQVRSWGGGGGKAQVLKSWGALQRSRTYMPGKTMERQDLQPRSLGEGGGGIICDSTPLPLEKVEGMSKYEEGRLRGYKGGETRSTTVDFHPP